jgi:hypothetical protein
MPATGRQRWIVLATWGATGTAPERYTLYRLNRQGYVNADDPGEALPAVDISSGAVMRVKIDDAVAAGAVTLALYGAAVANADTDDRFLAFTEELDRDQAEMRVANVQAIKGQSVPVNVDVDSCFYLVPVFLDAGEAPIAPGAIIVEFWIKE